MRPEWKSAVVGGLGGALLAIVVVFLLVAIAFASQNTQGVSVMAA